MIRHWQAIVLSLCWPPLVAQEAAKFEWTPPKTGAGLFSDQLGMLEREREEYADSLAAYASNRVAAASASAASLTEARRLLALALHLAPRNRKALVLGFQLSRGVLPVATPGDYRPDVLAGLLFTRAQLLKQQGGGRTSCLPAFSPSCRRRWIRRTTMRSMRASSNGSIKGRSTGRR